MLIVFLLAKPTPQERRNPQSWKYLSAHSRCIDMHRVSATGQLKTFPLIATQVNKAMRVAHIVADIWSGDARLGPMRAGQMIAKDNQVLGIGKRKRTQQNT